MTRSREVEKAHLDTLMYRMLGGLLLLGAGVLLCLMLVLLTFRRVDTANGHLLVLPGTGGRHTLAEAALPVLGIGILLLGLPGLLALALGRRQARFGLTPRGKLPPRSLRRPILVLFGGAALLVIVLLRR